MLSLAAEATHDPTSIALAIGILFFVVGVLGIVVPVLPGLLLCVTGVLVWAGYTGGTTAWVTFGVVAAIYAVTLLLQFLIPGRRMKREGVGGMTLALGVVGAIYEARPNVTIDIAALALKSGNAVAGIVWSGDLFVLRAETGDEDWEFVIPESGGTIWSDNMMIPITSTHRRNAERVMNYYYDPKVAAQVSKSVSPAASRSSKETTSAAQTCPSRVVTVTRRPPATTCAFVTTNPVRATKPDPSLPPEHSRDIDRTLTTAPETAEIRTAPRIRGLGGSTGRIRSSPTPTATVAIPSRLTRRCSGAAATRARSGTYRSTACSTRESAISWESGPSPTPRRGRTTSHMSPRVSSPETAAPGRRQRWPLPCLERRKSRRRALRPTARPTCCANAAHRTTMRSGRSPRAVAPRAATRSVHGS